MIGGDFPALAGAHALVGVNFDENVPESQGGKPEYRAFLHFLA